jgi:ATP adenylyltransferase
MMKSVYAPWREEYLLGAEGIKEKGCLFCRVLKEKRDKHNLILHRGERTFVIMNRYPYTSGHLMIAPYRHICVIEKLDVESACELMIETRRVVAILKKAFKPDGINVGMNLGRPAGAGVPGHLHIHIVPRWSGDTSFMPVVGGTRVVSVSLTTTYKILKPLF